MNLTQHPGLEDGFGICDTADMQASADSSRLACRLRRTFGLKYDCGSRRAEIFSTETYDPAYDKTVCYDVLNGNENAVLLKVPTSCCTAPRACMCDHACTSPHFGDCCLKCGKPEQGSALGVSDCSGWKAKVSNHFLSCGAKTNVSNMLIPSPANATSPAFMEPCVASSATGNSDVELDLKNIVTTASLGVGTTPKWKDDTNGAEHVFFTGTDSNNYHESDLLHLFPGVSKCVDFLSVNNKDRVCVADKSAGTSQGAAANTLYLRAPMDCVANSGAGCWKTQFLRGKVRCSDVWAADASDNTTACY